MGRHTKLDDAMTEQVAKYIRGGMFIETACALVGISKTTYHKWLKRGAREKSGPHRSFKEAIDVALAQAEASLVSRIASAGMRKTPNGKPIGDWRADAWRLERLARERWGSTQRHEVTGKDGDPVQVEHGIKIFLPAEDNAEPKTNAE